MVEINGKEFALNNFVCVGFLNNRNCYEIVSARIYDYNKTHIWLDCSQSGWDLEDTIKVQKDKIKYIVRTDNAMWR